MEHTLLAPGGRALTYLRLSVTDLCNLRCRYCMPPEGVTKLSHSDILTYEEALRLLRVASSLGMDKLRFTGGEPLVRRGLTSFVKRVNDEGLFSQMRLTTNGVLLAPLAADLKAGGVQGLNISIDALEPDVYAEMVGMGGESGRKLFRQAWGGFMAALEYGFTTKLNCVPIRGRNDSQILPLARLALEYPVTVRFIEHMPIGPDGIWKESAFISASELKETIEKEFGPLTWLEPEYPSAPARLFKPRGAPGAIGFISALSRHFCADCNRLRLTADGRLKPCLLTEREFDLRGPLRHGTDDEELRNLFLEAAGRKPISHQSAETVQTDCRRQMSRIGG
ncbi:GTP 3',8-cyclase MoaA [Deltaproteobacteria bacterium Smac51]|nr:GTP 3',8-cyclase MoaA [Deltaproteobacteria bacterium Smac51]